MTVENEAKRAAQLAMTIPGQIRETEAAYLYKLARQKGPIVEIGCLHGRSTSVLVQASSVFEAKVTSIDPFLLTPNTVQPRANFWRKNLESIGLDPPELLEMKSHDARKKYEGDIGFLFVDGGHTYDDVHRDIEDWAHRIKPNGIIAYHDMWQPAIPGVAKAVTEWWLGEWEKGSKGLAKWKVVGMVDYVIAFRRRA